MLNITKIVGENIKRLRTQCGWTQAQLALQMGINEKVISGLEHGRRGLSTSNIERVCDVFACLPHELFLPVHETDGDLIKRQLMAEIEIMGREDMATLCANAVALNAARGIKP